MSSIQVGDEVEVTSGRYAGGRGRVVWVGPEDVEIRGLIGWLAEAFCSLPRVRPADLRRIGPADRA
ncbi:mitochondrial 54S ribosomal protein L40 [Streptomyces kaniharaensis]|uniref:Mitochondrial 54S ribosomal protein L40 n=1 Tax=Streptomyces kaniharaensis TaxID=212423 RepID=A0A6N7L6G0_9ACTN|nr:KOW motif-containing protein [Streptomyces kaniharaensis]MQS17990.1 mitochondrial 54S ribosomal protein L40 [Streptomyces kaniharaensis]MQS18075.1 mitochondrial 54S ribosomal protein L40 [Streptomyces kaniharaensis]MQS18080.1 mitochondrial 54S ribosomal protein L40 [Streptomyces kaniharaensis]MQS18163.1 mitochondrial 54S ribosomal protein L40 [Streptomyces kaniharaensis]MQS18168.1 mitochondrial 54S ribosomal protein L40 [Streptomyces kaniharaensis]